MRTRRPYAQWEEDRIIAMYNEGQPLKEILKVIDNRTLASLNEKLLFMRYRGMVNRPVRPRLQINESQSTTPEAKP